MGDENHVEKNAHFAGIIANTIVDSTDTIKVLDSSKKVTENDTMHGNKQEVKDKLSY